MRRLLESVLVVALAWASVWATPPAQSAQPASFGTLSAQADAARDAGQLEKAEALYRRALALRPKWAEGWWSLGTIRYDADRYPEAAKAFEHLVAVDDANGTARLMLGLCQYQLAQYQPALANILAAERLGIRKDESLAHVMVFHKGLLLLRDGDYEGSLEALRLLADQGVRSEELDLTLGMAALLLRPQDPPPTAPQTREVLLRVGQAEWCNLAKKYPEARERYTALLRDFPDFPNLHYAYGRYLLHVNESDAAVAQFQQEIERQPKHLRARVEIAAAQYRVNSAAGIPYAKQVTELQPKYPFGHYLLGLLYMDSGETAAAIPELQTAAKLAPKEAQFQYALGNAYARAGRKAEAAEARAAFRKLSQETPQTASGSATEGQTSVPLRSDPEPPK